MSKWRVEVNWSCEVEAEDEDEALMEADTKFIFGSEAEAEEELPDEVEG